MTPEERKAKIEDLARRIANLKHDVEQHNKMLAARESRLRGMRDARAELDRVTVTIEIPRGIFRLARRYAVYPTCGHHSGVLDLLRVALLETKE